MKILLIGGTGVLSSAVAQQALQSGYKVFLLNRGNRPELIPSGAILLKANINNKQDVESKINGLYFDVIVDFLSYHKKQLNKTLNLLATHCLQFIFISSCAVYNKPDDDGYYRESSELGNKKWNYGRDKLKCEQLLKKYLNKQNKTKYTIIRPSITYGDTRIPYHIMPAYGWHWTLVERIKHQKPIPYWDKGDGETTITHVTDFAKGVVGLFMNKKAYNESFHITADTTYTWKEIIECVAKYINIEPIFCNIPKKYFIHKLPMYAGIIEGSRGRIAKYNNDKIKMAVPNFECKIDLNTGITRTLEYYKNHNYLKGIDYKWDADMDYLINQYNKAMHIPAQYTFIEYQPSKNTNQALETYAKRQSKTERIKIHFKEIIKHIIKGQ